MTPAKYNHVTAIRGQLTRRQRPQRMEEAFQSRLHKPLSSTCFEVEYTQRDVQRNGMGGWRMMFKELAESRRLIRLLALRDISVRYRQSVLGYAWAIIPQVVTVGLFAFLNAWRVLPTGETRIAYVAYASWGISVWQLFAACLMGCTTSLVSGGSLVTKVNFPKEALVIAALGQPTFDFIVRLVPVIAVFAWYGVVPSPGVVFLPLVLLPVMLLALGLGFILSLGNLVVRDTGNSVGMALTIGMFLTPVLYPPPLRWPYGLVNILNPVAPLLNASQDLIADGILTRPDMLVISCAFSFLLVFVGWRVFRVTLPRVSGYA